MGSTPVRCLSDTGVYQNGQGYERVMLWSGWDDRTPGRLARVSIRVDRVPDQSYARAEVHVDGTFVQGVAMPVNEFWGEMPGYLRWANDNSDTKTKDLARRRLIPILQSAVQVGSL